MTDSTTPITFEQGLGRLSEIVRQVESESVPIGTAIELVREGRGIERALREYLDQCQGELVEIETAEAPTTFRVVRNPPASAEPLTS
jgi:exodeoxyribonuclease VII small subunit